MSVGQRRPDSDDSVRELLGEARPGDDADERDALAALEQRMFGRSVREPITMDRYVLLDRIGQGGLGVVYRAHDPELDRYVAVKLLQAERFDTGPAPEGQARLLREAQALAKVTHPNVIAVYDVGTYERAPDRTVGEVSHRGVYVVMELVDGVDLRRWLQTAHGWRETLRVFVAAGRGLAAAHTRGLVHRDFKPGNVLIGRDGQVRVLDFGLARMAGAASVAPASEESVASPDKPSRLGAPLTRAGSVMGTPRYMAPEQLDQAEIDARSDQFSYCVALYEAMYRQQPFGGANGDALADAKRAGRFLPPPESSHVPTWVWRAVARGLAPDPNQRHGDMQELLDALERGLGRRQKVLVSAGLVAGLGAATLLGIAVGRTGPPTNDPVRAAAVDALEIPPDAPIDRHRIALLPFVDHTGDARLDFAVDGLPHLLSMELGRYADVDVVGYYRLRRRLRDEGATVDEWIGAARTAKAGVVVRGELDPRGELIAVSVIVETVTGQRLETLRREVAVEAVPDAVRNTATAVVRAAVGREVASPPSAKGRAFDLERSLQLGVAAVERDELAVAEQHLSDAIRIDPEAAEVHYYLALVRSWQSHPRDLVRRSIEQALAGDLSERQRSFMRGFQRLVERDYDGAMQLLRRAEEAYPDDRYVLYGLFEALFHAGRPQEAMDVHRQLVEVSPRFGLGLVHVLEYHAAHRDEDAFQRTLDHAARIGWDHHEQWMIRGLVMRGDYEAAIERLGRHSAEGVGGFAWARPMLAETYALAGQLPLALATAQHGADTDHRVLALFPLIGLHDLRDDPLARDRAHKRAMRLLHEARPSLGAAKNWIALGMIELAHGGDANLRPILDGLDAALADDYRHMLIVELGQALLGGALGDHERLQSARDSRFPPVRTVAEAFAAEQREDWHAAADAWAKTVSQTSEGPFVIVQHLRRAQALRRAADTGAAHAACTDVVAPGFFDWSWAPASMWCRRNAPPP